MKDADKPVHQRAVGLLADISVPDRQAAGRVGAPLRPGNEHEPVCDSGPGASHRAGNTPHSPRARGKAKFALIRRRSERGTSRDAILNLFRSTRWILHLPGDIASEFWQELRQDAEARTMLALTRVERIGQQEGLLAGIAVILELKFGPAGMALLPEIERLEDVTTIQRIQEGLRTVTTIEELRGLYA